MALPGLGHVVSVHRVHRINELRRSMEITHMSIADKVDIRIIYHKKITISGKLYEREYLTHAQYIDIVTPLILEKYNVTIQSIKIKEGKPDFYPHMKVWLS
jgi:hypothetical protein